jgi:serine O-acetyltransferase
MSFRALLHAWHADLYRHAGKADATTFLKHWLLSPGYTYTFYLRLCAYLHNKQPIALMFPLYGIARVLLRHYSYKFGIFIPFDTQIGVGFYIAHCGDIHFNAHTQVGQNCNISQGVTVGQSNRGDKKGCPVIGDGVYIGPGSKIFGAIRIGNNVAIGANCVVTKDVPDNAVVVGVPARIISYDGAADYVMDTSYAHAIY